MNTGKRTGLALAAMLVWSASTAGYSHAQSSSKQAEATAKGTVWAGCLNDTDRKLKAAKVAPDVYQLGLSGACLQEEADALNSLRTYLSSMKPDGPVSYADAMEVTENTVKMASRDMRNFRLKLTSDYALWQATQGGADPSASPAAGQP